MNTRRLYGILGLVAVVAIAFGAWFWSHNGPAAPVAASRPISDVDCGNTYQFDQIKRFWLDGRRVVNFHFGGNDRGRQPQYIADKDVLGLSTEAGRRVDRSLAYSEVTVLCLSDQMLEGHKASNITVLRYRLNLRRPLVPQRVIPNGGPARN